MKSIKIIAASIAIFAVSLTAVAEGARLSAQDVAQRLFDTHRGWGNLTANVRMELKQGSSTAVREMQMKMLELEKTGESDLLRVTLPADLSGTGLLTTTHDSGVEEQWLYLPAIKRVKRIAMDSKGGAFLSSEFSYENLEPFQVQKYSYQRLADETYANEICYVLQSIPVGTGSVYGKLINWIAQSDYRLLKTEFYGKDGVLEKTLYIEQFEKYREKYSRPVRLRMVSAKNNAVTVAQWSNLKYDERLDAREFDAANLKRIGF